MPLRCTMATWKAHIHQRQSGRKRPRGVGISDRKPSSRHDHSRTNFYHLPQWWTGGTWRKPSLKDELDLLLNFWMMQWTPVLYDKVECQISELIILCQSPLRQQVHLWTCEAIFWIVSCASEMARWTCRANYSLGLSWSISQHFSKVFVLCPVR